MDAKPKDDTDVTRWIKLLDNAFLKEGVSPSVAFKAADKNHNGVVTVDELRESIKRLVPEETISLVELKKVMMAFDTNRNGSIDEQEFINQIANARSTTITVLDSPAKPRVTADIPDDRRSRLPTKDQIGAKPQQAATNLAALVNSMNSKFNIKQMFADVTINEDGRQLVTQVSRRLKTIDGLTPSDFFPIIKALDPAGNGLLEVRDTIAFLDKYIQPNKTDYLLELRYMANFIEFKMQQSNTVTFFENNSNLKSGARLMEVAVMTELNKTFGVPM